MAASHWRCRSFLRIFGDFSGDRWRILTLTARRWYLLGLADCGRKRLLLLGFIPFQQNAVRTLDRGGVYLAGRGGR